MEDRSSEPRTLDSCARLHLDPRGRIGSYLGCGLVGVLLGAGAVVALGAARQLPGGLVAVSVAGPLVSFVLAVKLGRILVGYERIVLYECLAAVLVGSAVALALAQRPARFFLELVRGDDDRPSWLGLTEAQWIALVSAWLVVLSARSWSLDRGALYLGIAAALTVAALLVALASHIPAFALYDARRVRELHDALVALSAGWQASPDAIPPVTETPYGLRISCTERADGGGGRVVHCALSLAGRRLGARAARRVAGQVRCLLHLRAAPELSRGEAPGVFHLRWRASRD